MPQKSLPPNKLAWISGEDLDVAISLIYNNAKKTIRESAKRRSKNVVDPFYSVLIASSFDLKTVRELNNFQDAGSALRGISNHLGEFHQTVLGSIDGWRNHDAGYDLECPEKKIIAEVKNKHNTMNSTNRRVVVAELDTAIRQKQGNWEAYLVQIIPQKPKRSKNLILGKSVYEIDGASFYELATGYPNAIHDLFDEFCKKMTLSDEICEYCKYIMTDSLPPRK